MTLRIPPRLPWLAAVLLILFGPWTALGQTTSSSTCQLTDAMLASLDFSPLGSTCTGGSAVNCGACFCAVGRILYSGLQDQGGKALLESGNKTEIQDFITACQTAIGMKMITEAGTDFDTLLALQSCSAGSIPSTCFSDLIPSSSSNASSNTSSPTSSSSSPSTTSSGPSITSSSPSTTAFSTPSNATSSPPASLALDSANGNYYDDVPISAPAPVATPSSSLAKPPTTAAAAGGYYPPPTPVHVVYYPPPVISLHPPSPIAAPATIPAPAVVTPPATTIQTESPAPVPTAAVEETATPSPAVLNAAGSNAANPMLTVWLAAVASFLVLRRL